jgi:hypothetical protein
MQGKLDCKGPSRLEYTDEEGVRDDERSIRKRIMPETGSTRSLSIPQLPKSGTSEVRG